MKMEKVTHMNDVIRSLPGVRQRRLWNVVVDGVVVCGVKSTSKDRAMATVRQKYPTQHIELRFVGWRI